MKRLSKNSVILTSWLVALTVAITMLSCTTKKMGDSGRPLWIDKSTGFMDGIKGKGFYGVGTASNIPDVGLRRNAADAMARTELAKMFRSRVKNMMKIYQAQAAKQNNEQGSFEQHVQEVTKVFTDMELVGTRIVSRWYDSKANVQYSLALLSREEFIAELERMGSLGEAVRKFLKENADLVFEELR